MDIEKGIHSMSRFHGIASLLLILIATATGFIVISSTSPSLAGIYAAITLLSSGCIIYSYCLKCTCRETACGHVLPGKLTAFFPDRKSGAYTPLDFIATGVAIILIISFPQYWLWKYKPLFAVFWILIVVALADILLCVCRRCQNENCPLSSGGNLRDEC